MIKRTLLALTLLTTSLHAQEYWEHYLRDKQKNPQLSVMSYVHDLAFSEDNCEPAIDALSYFMVTGGNKGFSAKQATHRDKDTLIKAFSATSVFHCRIKKPLNYIELYEKYNHKLPDNDKTKRHLLIGQAIHAYVRYLDDFVTEVDKGPDQEKKYQYLITLTDEVAFKPFINQLDHYFYKECIKLFPAGLTTEDKAYLNKILLDVFTLKAVKSILSTAFPDDLNIVDQVDQSRVDETKSFLEKEINNAK